MTDTLPVTAADAASFAAFNLHELTLKAINDSGYTTPTAIQQQAIPIVLAGNDIVGCAQTGTGKTASYTLPLIEKLLTGRRRARMPRALILAPTREIALQVEENFKKYAKHHRLYSVTLVGGMSPVMQERAIMNGVDVLIATPGRLMDHMARGKIILTDVQTLVIDEADRMLDMGFIPDVEKIVRTLPATRQTLMFSATMAKPIRVLASKFLNSPKEVTIEPKVMTSASVEQFYCPVPNTHEAKREAFRKLIELQTIYKAIVFSNRKRDVSIIAKDLTKNGFRAAELHGDMSQGQRLKTLARFKEGKIDFLVASDVAARGIHVEALPTVINYDVPTKPDDYVHRIGRTGRAGDIGKAFTLVTNDQKKHYDDVLSHIKSTMELFDLGYNIVFDERSAAPSRGRGGRSGGRSFGGGGGRPQGGFNRGGGEGRRFGNSEGRPQGNGESRRTRAEGEARPQSGEGRRFNNEGSNPRPRFNAEGAGSGNPRPRFAKPEGAATGDKPKFQARRGNSNGAPRRAEGGESAGGEGMPSFLNRSAKRPNSNAKKTSA